MNFLSKIFGKKVDFHEVIAKGAVIVDVRTKGEYQEGHLKNSINIPLDKIGQNMAKLDKNRPIITCCASGGRSSSAKSILETNGFKEVYNGGPWQSLKRFTS